MLLFVVTLLLSGCVSGEGGDSRGFALHVSALTEAPTAAQPIVVTAALTITSERAVQILHSSPLTQIQIYDENDRPIVKTFLTHDVGIVHMLKPNEPYDPDTANNVTGKRVIRVERPGTYRLVGTASFYIQTEEGELGEEQKVTSAPYEIVVR